MDDLLDILQDSILDSSKVFFLALIIFIIFSLFEHKLVSFFKKQNKLSPLIGASLGLIPECGVSVVTARMYSFSFISTGTIFAVFFASSDEALTILFTNSKTIPSGLLLMGIKLSCGFLFGFLIDLFLKRKLNDFDESKIHKYGDENNLEKYLIHPFLHALEIFFYVFAVSLIFGIVIYLIGEEKIYHFLEINKYSSVLYSSIIGFIPNCASSVLITNLYINNGIPFAALVSGLCMNSGIGVLYLLKCKRSFKAKSFIILSLFILSNVVGYVILLISQFI